MKTHEELISEAFRVYRNSKSSALNQNLTDTEIVNKLNEMNDGFLNSFIARFS